MQQLTANPRSLAADSNLAALRDAIQLFMGELPENWADALRLRIEGQLSYEEIAQTLECTQAQVRTWIYRARRQLEEELRHSGLLAGECQS